jgi:hypothetical protein
MFIELFSLGNGTPPLLYWILEFTVVTLAIVVGEVIVQFLDDLFIQRVTARITRRQKRKEQRQTKIQEKISEIEPPKSNV